MQSDAVWHWIACLTVTLYMFDNLCTRLFGGSACVVR